MNTLTHRLPIHDTVQNSLDSQGVLAYHNLHHHIHSQHYCIQDHRKSYYVYQIETSYKQTIPKSTRAIIMNTLTHRLSNQQWAQNSLDSLGVVEVNNLHHHIHTQWCYILEDSTSLQQETGKEPHIVDILG